MMEDNGGGSSMKKVSVIILLAAMALSVCACGKSSAIKAAEESIKAIGEVSIDSKEAIAAAEQAYNALSDSDKAKVENANELTSAKENFFRIQLDSYRNQMSELCDDCEYVTEFVETAWSNLGPSDVMSCLNNAKLITNPETTAEEYASAWTTILEQEWTVDDVKKVAAMVARGVYPDGLRKINGIALLEFLDEESVQKTISLAGNYSMKRSAIEAAQDGLFKEIKDFKNEYSSQYDIVNDLSSWVVDCGLYCDFALNPSGSLAEYKSSKAEYEKEMSRYEKLLEAY